ncbi:MAG: ATP-binding protein [Armatimonadetes bacterium]|nr:ATP-binding protein [Armatimonadota bacterium]
MPEPKSVQRAQAQLYMGRLWPHTREPATIPPDPDRLIFHTAILAQSGAGKSCFLARFIEEILLKTGCRVLILDVNGDFCNIREQNKEAWPDELGGKKRKGVLLPQGDPCDVSNAAEFGTKWSSLDTHSVAPTRWKIPWHLLATQDQAALLGIDPRRDPSTFMALYEVDAHLIGGNRNEVKFYPISELWQVARGESEYRWDPNANGPRMPGPRWKSDALASALSFLHDWSWWAQAESDPTIATLLGSVGWRCRALSLWDLGTGAEGPLGRSVEERQIAAKVVALHTLDILTKLAFDAWQCRTGGKEGGDWIPTFVVVDEAQRFAPASEDADALTCRLRDRIETIAAEGRKYGLHLVLASQRPTKIHPGILSDCENVCLLRLRSPLEHELATRLWGIQPKELEGIEHAKPGEARLFGPWTQSAGMHLNTCLRRTAEGGANPTWPQRG